MHLEQLHLLFYTFEAIFKTDKPAKGASIANNVIALLVKQQENSNNYSLPSPRSNTIYDNPIFREIPYI